MIKKERKREEGGGGKEKYKRKEHRTRENNVLKFMQIEFSPAKYNLNRIKLNVANMMMYTCRFLSSSSKTFSIITPLVVSIV